jgi:D-alanine-D-alanine ligase
MRVKIKVNQNWWKDIFDEIYLLTDSRSVCNEELTRQEVDFIEKTLNLQKTSPILDLCGGQGRHSLELSKRGYKSVTVLDYSQYLIDLGCEKATKENLNTIFIRQDARKTGLPSEKFRYIVIMASSFGYFSDDEENKKILREVYRLLMRGGTLLLDLPDRDYCIQNFKPFSTHSLDHDIIINRERELKHDIICSREIVRSEKNGCIRDATYCIRLYSLEKITSLLHSEGFSSVSCRKDFMNRETGGDYGCMTNRMVVTASKI